jgi:hypothetical protein
MIAWSENHTPASDNRGGDGDHQPLPARTQAQKQYPNPSGVGQEQ